jgi:nicotinamidase-related amidase
MPPRHPTLLQRDDTLLLVIDMQEPFLRGIPDRAALARNVNLLISGGRVLQIPIIASAQYQGRMGGFIPEVAQHLPDYCSPVNKLCFSCGASDELSAAIADTGRRQVLICGVETHICVCQTALDLAAAGYQTHVAADSVSSRSELTHHIALERLRAAGIILTTAESALYELLHQAATPEFKQILTLVKQAAEFDHEQRIPRPGI